MRRKEDIINIKMVKGKPKKVSKEKPKKKVVAKEKPVDKKKDSLEENLSEDLPLEIVDGITDSLEQVDVRSLLRHSGEEEQKTRAHLEEELGDAPWVSQEEDKREITYGGLKNGSGDGPSHKYEEINPNVDPVKKTYESMNLYEAHENFYDPTHTNVKDDELGKIRGRGDSELEIQGISKERKLTTSEFTEGYPSEDYE